MRIKIFQKIIDVIRGKKEVDTRYIDPQDKFPVRLSEYEREFLVMHIRNAKNYLEYGSGGSTFLSLKKTRISSIVSVESDENWLNHLRNWEMITNGEKSSRLKFMHVNIGKTGEWGVPLEADKKELFPKYSFCPFERNEKYDAIFIDGRFRVACALQSILNSEKDTKILMHDFNNRPEYHCLLQFLDIVDTADTMALFKIKEDCDEKELANLWEKYKYVWE